MAIDVTSITSFFRVDTIIRGLHCVVLEEYDPLCSTMMAQWVRLCSWEEVQGVPHYFFLLGVGTGGLWGSGVSVNVSLLVTKLSDIL